MKTRLFVLVLSLVVTAADVTGQTRQAALLTAKVFLGSCVPNCAPTANATYPSGSIVRWRIAVANVGYGQITSCTITDQLPNGFSFVGNCAYTYAAVSPHLTPSNPSCCATNTTVPAQVGGMFLAQPQSGSSTLTWVFAALPPQPMGPATYFVIDFDVLVGNVPEGRYCNSFTAAARTVTLQNENIDTVITSVSNIAQVTISGTSSPAGYGIGVTNPYVAGTRGNWYADTSWSYLTTRVRSTNVTAPQTNVRHDGVFASYSPFWRYQNAQWQADRTGWQWVEEVSKKDVNGLTAETKDVLERFSSLMTGYRNRLVVAVANNARNNEVLYEGFEDWNYTPMGAFCDTTIACRPHIVNWNDVFELSSNESHSGKASGLLVGAKRIVSIPCITNGSTDSARKATCLGLFTPTAGMRYVVSAWVRDNSDPIATSFDQPAILVNGDAFKTSGNVIDGWQQISGTFDLPPTATNLTISFEGGAGKTWYDDIRIFPFDAKLVTHSYDGNTQKLTFTCDENNYFTKYNYDASDNLESINKETERGVLTVRESRTGMVKRP